MTPPWEPRNIVKSIVLHRICHPSHPDAWVPSLLPGGCRIIGCILQPLNGNAFGREKRLGQSWAGTGIMSLEGDQWEQKPVLGRGKRLTGCSWPGSLSLWEAFPSLACHGGFGSWYTWQPPLGRAHGRIFLVCLLLAAPVPRAWEEAPHSGVQYIHRPDPLAPAPALCSGELL